MSSFKPLLGNIKKYEYKFVCVKPHLLKDFLFENARRLEEYSIEQKYVGDDKYRQYITNDNEVICTKHIRTSDENDRHDKTVDIFKISADEYDSVKSEYIVYKARQAYTLVSDAFKDVIINLDRIWTPLSVELADKKTISLVEIWSTNKQQIEQFISQHDFSKFLIPVSDNKYFHNDYIAKHDINITTRPVVVLEGTDLIGKSTVVKEMVSRGYLCLDRDQESFSSCVTLDNSPADIADKIVLNYDIDEKHEQKKFVVVLTIEDEEILLKRLYERYKTGKISEYDMQCVQYNEIYQDVISNLRHRRDYFTEIMVDSNRMSRTDTPDEICDAIIKRIEKFYYNKVYIATKFKLNNNTELALEDRLVDDIRSKLLGDSKKLAYFNSSSACLIKTKNLNDRKIVYNGPFYCEEASSGILTSTDCNEVVSKELTAVDECDTFIVYFDENFSCGSVVELMYAVSRSKNVLVIYKEEASVKYETKSEHWFAIVSALKLSPARRINVVAVKSEDEVLGVIKSALEKQGD